jgi:hypothetical protein
MLEVGHARTFTRSPQQCPAFPSTNHRKVVNVLLAHIAESRFFIPLHLIPEFGTGEGKGRKLVGGTHELIGLLRDDDCSQIRRFVCIIPRAVENESEGTGLFSKQSIMPGASCWDVGWTLRQPVRP